MTCCLGSPLDRFSWGCLSWLLVEAHTVRGGGQAVPSIINAREEIMYRTLLRLVIGIIVIASIGAIGTVIYKRLTVSLKTEHRLSVEQIERMGKLVLVRITIKDVLKQTKQRPFYLPNATALFIIVGEVSAGIDLEKVKKEDFVESETQVTVKLPKPEILMSKINHEKSEIYDVKNGWWSNVQLVDEAYKAAETKITEAANGTRPEKR